MQDELGPAWNETYVQRAPVSVRPTGTAAQLLGLQPPPRMCLPVQQQMCSHPMLTWPFVVTCMPSMGGFDTSGIRSRSINIKVLASWCESQSALGESAQVWLELAERWCLPSKVRSSHVCRWWIYGENQSQIDCHPFYLHLNCLPTQLRIQHNLIKSVKIYFCLRNNVLLCSYLMSCELTCFNKSFTAYYIHSLDGNFKIWPLKWDSFHNSLMMALRTVHFIFAFGLEL